MDTEKIKLIIHSEFGFDAEVENLVGYEDFNFRVTQNANQYIFKVHKSETFPHLLDAQNQFIQHLSKSVVQQYIPKTKQSLFGSSIIDLKKYGLENHYGRLLTYLDGQLYYESPQNLRTISELGRITGLINKSSLDFFDHRFHLQSHAWNLTYSSSYINEIHYITDISIKRLVHYYLDQFKYYSDEFNDILPKQIIHGDINDYNILVDQGDITGIIDFGDSCYSARISEIAIAITYVLMGRSDILDASIAFIKAYNKVNPIQKTELRVLYYFIAARLSISLINAYRNQQLNPSSNYHQVSFELAKSLIKKWVQLNPFLFEQQILNACNYKIEAPLDLYPGRMQHFGKSYSISYDQPLHIEKAALHYLYDVDGKTYLDCVNNISHVGHCHPKINEAITRQIHQLNTNTRYLYQPLNNYLKKLTDKFPFPLKVAYLTNSGSEAGDLAQRIAKTITGRQDIIVMDHGYHGNTTAGVNISAYKFNRKGGQGKQENIHILTMPDRNRGKYADRENFLEAHLEELDTLLNELEKLDRLPAAFYSETILGCGGQIFLPENYFKEVFKRMRAKGVLCIIDEVQVGFGRIGSHFWAFEYHDIDPDIVVIGKPMGNGHPIAGLVTTSEISDSFNNGMEFFSSFGGNPVSCEIGNAVLDIIDEEHLQQNAHEVGIYFLTQLNNLKAIYPIIADVRGQGLFIGIELLKDNQPATEETKRIVEEMKNNQILLSVDGPDNNVIKIKPPIIFEKEHVDFVCHTLKKVCDKLFLT